MHFPSVSIIAIIILLVRSSDGEPELTKISRDTVKDMHSHHPSLAELEAGKRFDSIASDLFKKSIKLTDQDEMKRHFDSIASDIFKKRQFDSIASDLFRKRPFDSIASDIFKKRNFDSIASDIFKKRNFDSIASDIFKKRSFDSIASDLFKKRHFDSIASDLFKRPFDSIASDLWKKRQFDSIASDLFQKRPFDSIASDLMKKRPFDSIASDIMKKSNLQPKDMQLNAEEAEETRYSQDGVGKDQEEYDEDNEGAEDMKNRENLAINGSGDQWETTRHNQHPRMRRSPWRQQRAFWPYYSPYYNQQVRSDNGYRHYLDSIASDLIRKRSSRSEDFSGYVEYPFQHKVQSAMGAEF